MTDADKKAARQSAELKRLEDSTRVGRALEKVGAVPQRAAVGDGPRGLQPERRRVAVLHPRSGAVARVPLGRGRARGLLRPEAATVFRPGALEREGPDSEGAALRVEQCRGEPRRGREGVLLLSRFHADPLVHEVALQVPAGRLSVRRSRDDECASLAPGARVRADRHRRVRRRPLLRRLRRIREVVSGGMLRSDHRREPGPGDRDDSSAADPVVPQHVELVARRGETPPGGGESEPAARASWRRRTRSLAIAGSTATARRRCCSPRTTRTPSGSSTRPTRAPTSRTPSTRSSCTGKPTPSTRRRSAPRPPPTTASRSAPASRWRSGSVSPTRRRPPDPFAAFEQDDRGQAPRGGRVLPILHAGRPRARTPRSVMRQAFGGLFWTKQYYFFDVNMWLREHGVDPFDAPASVAGQEPPLVPHVQRRRHLDAGQVGVPVVRRLGSRLSRGRARGRRSGLRQASAQPDVEGALSALQRSAARLRVELRRRQPAGACVGDALPVPDRAGAARQGGHRVPQARLRQAARELHVVGESQGPPGQERVRGRLPRPRQHRRLRPQRRAADRRPPRAGRRHRVDGDVLPEHARDRRRDRGPRLRATTTSPTSSPSTSCGSAPP